MDRVAFSEWILKKFVQWRGDAVGHEATIEKFASEIGVGRSLVSQWMKPGGKVPTSKKAIDGLVRLFGPEVYEVLGLPAPEAVEIPFESLPSDIRSAFAAASAEIKSAFSSRHISDPDSPEGKELAISIFEKHGFTVTTIR